MTNHKRSNRSKRPGRPRSSSDRRAPMVILPIIIRARASCPRRSRPSPIKDGRVHHGMARLTQVTSIAVMEVTPNSPNSETLGTVIKQITVLHTLHKNSPMKGKGFRKFYSKKLLLPYRKKKVTNLIIGGLLADPHRSPLTQCCCFTRNSPKITIVRDTSTY